MDKQVLWDVNKEFLTINEWHEYIENCLENPEDSKVICNINADDDREFDAIFFGGGAGAMVTLLWLRQRLPWWPVHPIGLPVGATPMMNRLWFNVFVAWVVKQAVMRYGGASGYQRSQPFFLGLIVGQVLCSGGWLVIDYFTGRVGNYLYEI